MLFHMIYYLVCLCLSFFFRWTSKIYPEMKTSSEKNGQKEFPTLLAGIADQVLPLQVEFFFCFLLSKIIIFF